MKMFISCAGLLLLQASVLSTQPEQHKGFFSTSKEILQFLTANESTIYDSTNFFLENRTLFITTVEFYVEYKKTLYEMVALRLISKDEAIKKDIKPVKGFSDMVSFYAANKVILNRAGTYFVNNQENIRSSLNFFNQYGDALAAFVMQRKIDPANSANKTINISVHTNQKTKGINELTALFTQNQSNITAFLEYFEEREFMIMAAMDFFSRNADTLKQKLGY